MKKLCDLVKIEENNEELVLLKVKPKSSMELIKLGFSGNETLLRLTKGKNHTCTIWNSEGKSFSWNWGESGYTLVSEELSAMGRKIQNCLEMDFGIYLGTNKNLIKITTAYKKLKDDLKMPHSFKAMYWKGRKDSICVHRDDEYLSHFPTVEKVVEYISEHYGNCVKKDPYIASTGCVVEVFATK